MAKKKENVYELPIRNAITGETVMVINLKETIAEKVHSKEDLEQLVNEINDEIERQNMELIKAAQMELLQMKFIMQRFERIFHSMEIKEFRKEHGCYSCIYWEGPNRCPAQKQCPVEQGERKLKPEQAKGCPENDNKPCPYSNNSGTCFGSCLKKHLSDLRSA